MRLLILCILTLGISTSELPAPFAHFNLLSIPAAEAKITCRSIGKVWDKRTKSCVKSNPRYRNPKGRNAPPCNDSKPGACTFPGIKTKGNRTIYVVPQICATMKKNKSCVYTIGFRSCQTNSSIRGAARNSAHLCGKAVDIRLGTCKLGDYHGKGSAAHRHYEIGKCQ
jgi:hypothetical protein